MKRAPPTLAVQNVMANLLTTIDFARWEAMPPRRLHISLTQVGLQEKMEV